MGSHILQIFRQGVWAALTGGWYHDPHDSQFNNICHFYLWIFLLLLPLAMHLGLPSTKFTICLYCVSTTILFAVIKFLSFRLHLMFDKGIVNHQKKNKGQPKQEINITNCHPVPRCSMKRGSVEELKSQDERRCPQNIHRNISSDSLMMQTLDNQKELKDNGATENVKQNATCCENLSEIPNSGLEIEFTGVGSNNCPSTDQLSDFQMTRKKIIYEVTCVHSSQQESTVLQVFCGTTASLQDDTQLNKESRKTCFLMDGNQSAEHIENITPKCASISDDTELNSDPETSGNHRLFSDPEEESQASVITVKGSRCGTAHSLSNESEKSSNVKSVTSFQRKAFYKFHIFPGKWIKVWCDRLTLLALLDKTENIVENILAILLAIFVSFFGFSVLQKDVFRDIWIFQFCVVIASCQFCLLKSVQPDPASPVHGYNQIITYSRPVYFCILCGFILLLDAGAKLTEMQFPTMYGFQFFSPDVLKTIRDQLIVFVSCFPIISLLGLFPQVNTFCVYFLEQIDILLFGGTATAGFGSSLFSLLRSTLAVVMLYSICSYSIKETWDQHIPPVFSAFCGLLIALSYHLSRQGSDPSIIKSFISYKCFPKWIHENLISSTNCEDPLPGKMKSSLKEILMSDLIVCTLVGFLSFAVSASTVFLLLSPILSTVLFVMALTVGLLAHYIIPQLRKHHPWLWIAQPLLQNKEYTQREIIGAAQLMWFEKLYIWLVCFEKYVLYPSIILSAVTTEASSISGIKRFGKHTKRLDNMNTRLKHQIEKDPGNDNDNLNSIFYEHLTRSLQHSLCGDLILGRWGNYASGDCFILTSDYLNAFVHLVETGNGFVTFQLRGLEFKGTYCHQREVEAITEGDEDNKGCCCFQIGHLPHVLSCNAAFNLRWMTWEIARNQYILEGYSVISSNAASLFHVFDLRKILIKYFVKSIIYFIVKSSKLLHWLEDESMQNALQPYTRWNHVECDLAIFNINVDEDYIQCLQGISRASFCGVYLDWIQYCAKMETKKVATDEDSFLVTLSFGLCILGRRLLAAAHHMPFSLDAFLHGLHTLFKGHYQISKEEEWVFADMDLLHTVVSPAIRMALKLHQSQFACPEEFEDPVALYEAIKTFGEKIVICDEEDPAWRSAILSNKKELLTLRHAVEDGNDEYSVIMLHKSYLNFKVIKVNKECVRGLWAGQQQELIFFRNRDHERGSIQNNKHVLRNLINSSCDQPLGYPIYVSPLTTSYLGTHNQLKELLGGPVNFDIFTSWFQTKWLLMKKDYDRSHNSGSINEEVDCEGGLSSATINSESNTSESLRKSSNACHKDSGARSLENKAHQMKAKRKYRSQSAYTHSSLNQIHGVSSLTGSNMEKCHNTSTDKYKDVKRLSSSHHCLNSARSHYPPTGISPTSAAINIHEHTRGFHQSSQTLSTNSTLSLLFGKKGFSSALVLSGLSAADGDNTADTLSSGSVNLVVCSRSKVADQSTENVYKTIDIDDPTTPGQK
ncbi:pecanex-like protein 2 isoform X2 [Ranitomeya variabilis]|uniref:pecanex-like protein 2 isoform X2 n=1 Tax=Ranitomeya variabilis TaxID=490064 RepID=UPI0040561C60